MPPSRTKALSHTKPHHELILRPSNSSQTKPCPPRFCTIPQCKTTRKSLRLKPRYHALPQPSRPVPLANTSETTPRQNSEQRTNISNRPTTSPLSPMPPKNTFFQNLEVPKSTLITPILQQLLCIPTQLELSQDRQYGHDREPTNKTTPIHATLGASVTSSYSCGVSTLVLCFCFFYCFSFFAR